MAVDNLVQRVLRVYPDDCQASEIEPLEPADSFSGAQLWRLKTRRGELCLRRFPNEHPTPERLEFSQAVLWHVVQEGFRQVSLPLETCHRHGYVRHDGALWELSRWIPGDANYRKAPNLSKLRNASVTLARFHEAARSFPLPQSDAQQSPGIVDRRERMNELRAGKFDELQMAVGAGGWPELAGLARATCDLFHSMAPRIHPILAAAAELRVPLQPCIRDVWSAHVLFVGDEVSGIVDFSAMRPENVAADVARLLGSLAADDALDWGRGLAAYQSVRRLSRDERQLVSVFDQSSVLLAPLQWLEWIYLEKRQFSRPAAVVARYRELFDRLVKHSQMCGDDALR